jgi:hypothetical protein
VWSACLVLAAPTLVLLGLGVGESTPGDSFGLGGYGGLSFVVAALAFGTVGALVMQRVPANPIGPVFCLMGLTLGMGDLAYQYADQALYGSSSLPGGDVEAWLQNLGLPPSFGLLGIALVLFPDGRLPSRRWRPALWLAVAGMTLIVVGYALRPGPLDDPFQTVSNPFGVPGAFDILDAASGFGWIFMGMSVAVAAAALIVRLGRSSGHERQQLKWIALAATVTGVAVGADVVSFFAALEGQRIEQLRIVLLGVAFSALPVAAGMAILRYRLYDIDVVINRALVYGALSTILAGAYLGGVVLLQLVLSGVTQGSGLAVAASTLSVAALFRPARARVQEAVDRRFYRRKYDAAQTLERFAVHLREEVDLDALRAELGSVVANTMQPAHVSVWLREQGSNAPR